MKSNLRWLLVMMLSITLGACEKESDPETITESWGAVLNSDPDSQGEETFVKHEDGSISTSGSWVFNGVTCVFTNGVVLVNDTLITFTAQGTATNPAAPSGYQSSPFNLHVTGSAHNGQGMHFWDISFSTYGWPATVNGTAVATRISGSGITN